ncbi:PLP-dependent transferase [Synechococcus sp. UW179B]|uniref:PLP-dependent transferase n=1 Tax=Synechococcus sp. UW179B TaxID=2575516 RepID=UPI000E0F7A76|nr:PLP-dependent transferase [Synechococcus sp. UW179B]
MSPRDLLRNPCWQGEDLGHPLPDSTHAVSVALPRWRDVIAYEDNDPQCRSQLRAFYPRFALHPLVAEVARKALAMLPAGMASAGSSAWPYPNRAAAQLAQDHCHGVAPHASTQIVDQLGLAVLIANAEASPHAKAFWQHAGLGASSRRAAIGLSKEAAPAAGSADQAQALVIERLASIYRCDTQQLSLHPSGMAALHTALQLVTAMRPGRPTLQIGFPYVDVLKLPQVVFAGSELLLETSNAAVEAALDRIDPAAVIVELPSNPLLQCVDLATLARLAHARGIPVIADDTIGSCLNIDPLPYADLIFSSLTKSFAGRGDVLSGSLVVSPWSPWEQTFRDQRSITGFVALGDADVIALEQGSRDVQARVPQLNRHAQALAARLSNHPAVARVYYPDQCANFHSLLRPGAGHGCLLSFELKGGSDQAQAVYDALSVCKGPSLGTPFTLVCPYVLLAHYDELAWAEDCGVPAHLLRVSVGLEQPEELWQRFERALSR